MSPTYNERIDSWLQVLWDQRVDLVLVSSSAAGQDRRSLRPLESAPVLTGAEITELVHSMLGPDQKAILDEHLDVDFSLSRQDKARLRGSAFHQRGELALALRMTPSEIPSFEELGLPPIAEWLARLPRGLVLLTGPTGSGKSTTLATIIDRINETRARHILTIEDPVEYVHAQALGRPPARNMPRRPFRSAALRPPRGR